MKEGEIKKYVGDRYARTAKRGSSCCRPATSCCGGGKETDIFSKSIGYTDQDLKAVPEGANLGLGSGNPLALASLREGEAILDLGSGAGFDCFLAARQVGKSGKVIGVDMTPEMLDKARENAQKGDFGNVEFRLGEIENLPVADNQVDIVISNCVINLSPAKERVFREAFRVLKPGGRLMVSDIVLKKDLPEEIKNSVLAYTACLAGAVRKEKYLGSILAAGFQETEVLEETNYPLEIPHNDPTAKAIIESLGSPTKARELATAIASIKLQAKKPPNKPLKIEEKIRYTYFWERATSLMRKFPDMWTILSWPRIRKKPQDASAWRSMEKLDSSRRWPLKLPFAIRVSQGLFTRNVRNTWGPSECGTFTC